MFVGNWMAQLHTVQILYTTPPSSQWIKFCLGKMVCKVGFLSSCKPPAGLCYTQCIAYLKLSNLLKFSTFSFFSILNIFSDIFFEYFSFSKNVKSITKVPGLSTFGSNGSLTLQRNHFKWLTCLLMVYLILPFSHLFRDALLDSGLQSHLVIPGPLFINLS